MGTRVFHIDYGKDVKPVEQFVSGMRDAVARGVYKPGDVLPPMVELARTYGISMRSVREAMARLSDESVLRSIPHVGAVVLGKGSPVWKGRVAFVAVDNRENYYFNVLVNAFQSHLEESGWRFDPIFINRGTDGKLDIRRLRCKLYQKIDLAMCMTSSRQVFAALENARVPYAVCHHSSSDVPGAIHTFRIADVGAAMQELVLRCKSMGIRNILELGFGDGLGDPAIAPLLKAGFKVKRCFRLRDHRLGYLEGMEKVGGRLVTDYVLKRKERPDLLLFANDFVARGGLFALAASGLVAPRDFRCVTFANKGYMPFYPKRLSCIVANPVEHGKALSEYAMKLACGMKDVVPPCISSKFEAGQTL